MKRRIISIIASIVMAVSVFSSAVVAADKTEPSIKVHEWWGEAGTWQYNQIKDYENNDTMVLEATSANWGTINCKQIVSGLDSAKTYVLSARIKGDWSSMNWGVKQLATGEVLGGSWREISIEFTGATNITLSAQIQSAQGYNNGTAYLDDVVVKNGDEVVFSEDFESAPVPTPPAPPTKAPQEPSDPDTLKIMCIGDSITHGGIVGDTDEQSYRYPLWKMLVDEGIKFEFVGSVTTSFGTQQTYEDYKGLKFPNIHEGYWGWTIQGVTPKIKESLQAGNLPDVAIINLGTNNEGQDESYDSKKAAMATLIDTMREQKSDIKFILAGPFNTWFADLRTKYADLAKEKSTVESPIIVTEQPAIVDDPSAAGSWTEDWVHTNRTGDEGTAKVIFKALQNFMTESEEPTPTASATASAPIVNSGNPAPVGTAAPSAVATVAPTASAVATATPVTTPAPKKVKISFKKKSVKIKKGKKVTLKVTLKNAKKAKFSVDKKGKKVVKLSKKKAKSVVVKGKKKGKATITAKAGNKKATCKVKVK